MIIGSRSLLLEAGRIVQAKPNHQNDTSAPPAARPQITLAGRIAYRVLPLRRQVVRANLRRAFGEALTETDRARLAQAFYSHLLRSVWEFLQAPFTRTESRKARVRVESQEVVQEAMRSGRGVLLLAGHLGNWEIACADGILSCPELRGHLHVIRRPIAPKWLDRYVRARFHRAGIGTIAKKDALRSVLDRLAANDAVAFVLDQSTATSEAVRVKFFGSAAWTSRSLAVVARRTKAIVIPIATWRERDGKHVLRFEAPLAPIAGRDLDEAIRLNTQLYNDTLERLIRRHPEQWNWIHRRWKSES